MDSGTQDSRRGSSSTKKSIPNSRRVWSTREEKVLIQALKDIVSQGWKSDNGFRTGYLTKLQDAIKKEFSMTNLVASPNITSKLTTWKKAMVVLSLHTKQQELGFNCTTSQLDVTDDQWAEVIKVMHCL